MSVRELVRHKLDRLRAELRREDLDRATRALRIAELSIEATGVERAVVVRHARFYELTTPPKQFRGLRDLVIRRAAPADAAALAALDATPDALVAERFARGDLVYVGELDGRMLAHSWFHRGPEPFGEDTPVFPRWAIADDTFWSYHAVTTPDARTSGVFVKLFQVALRELFTERGAARVRCRVHASNTSSILLHERTGFRCLGTVIALAVPGARWLSWRGDGGTRRWLQRRGGDTVLALPPEEHA